MESIASVAESLIDSSAPGELALRILEADVEHRRGKYLYWAGQTPGGADCLIVSTYELDLSQEEKIKLGLGAVVIDRQSMVIDFNDEKALERDAFLDDVYEKLSKLSSSNGRLLFYPESVPDEYQTYLAELIGSILQVSDEDEVENE